MMRNIVNGDDDDDDDSHSEVINGDDDDDDGVVNDDDAVPSNIVRFKKISCQFKVPFVIYYDFECLLPESNVHVPSGFCCYTVSDFERTEPVYYSGPEVMSKFFQHLESERNRICQILKRNMPMRELTPLEDKRFRESQTCESCQNAYTLSNRKVHHHCHITSAFIAPVCNNCNLQLKPKKHVTDYVIVLIAHNAKNYDFHLLLKHLPPRFKHSNITVIPTNTEKYISVRIGMLRFIDSYQFLVAGLSTLVDNLRRSGQDKFVHSALHLGQHLDLVTRKQIFPYEFVTSFDKLDHPGLPAREDFYSSLTETNVSEEEYRHAQKVWQTLKLDTLKDYQNLYVMTDVLLLADVFEEFRRMSLSYYQLDPAHFYTTPGLTFQASLKHSKVSFELLTDVDMLLTIERGIRGGSSYIGCREALANNRYLPDSYDDTRPSTFVTLLDANNLYGYAMLQNLPIGEYKWLTRAELAHIRIPQLPDDGEYGYVFVVDLLYPPRLHDKHNCYPLAVEHVLLNERHLSDVSKNLLGGKPFRQVRKLVSTLSDKHHYVVHYRNLKLYLREGLVIKRIHSVIRFKQCRWLSGYISKNTEFRANAKTAFEKDFFKLLNNSLYGKLMQNLRNKCNVHFVSDVMAAERQLCKHTCIRWTEINETFSVVHQRVNKIFWDKATIVGFTILELSKLLMYEFHYGCMLPMYTEVKLRADGWPLHECRLKLLFTDTDSFCYSIETDDLYRDMKRIQHMLDTAEYSVHHPLFSTDNAKVIGKFKDECNGVPPLHFVGLRPKLYSLLVTKDVSKTKAKGVPMRYTKKHLRHQEFVRCLRDGTTVTASFKQIRSRHHVITTDTVRKVALSSFYDKRWVLPDTPCTLAQGHWRIAHAQHTDVQVESPYDCDECADRYCAP